MLVLIGPICESVAIIEPLLQRQLQRSVNDDCVTCNKGLRGVAGMTKQNVAVPSWECATEENSLVRACWMPWATQSMRLVMVPVDAK